MRVRQIYILTLLIVIQGWVKRWPKFCGDGPDGTGEPCKSHLIAWAFGVWIAIFVLGSLIINNLIIWFFVHNQTKKRQRQSSNTLPSSQDDDDDDSSSDEDDDNDDDPHKAGQRETISIASSFRTAAVQAQKRAEKENQQLLDRRTQKMQNRRLRLVSSQALLFVGCFVISNLWAYILRFYEAQATEFVDEMELPFHNYHFLVLQATLLPLQGLFNMMVYIRPKYLKNRSEFHLESKLWAIRRSIFGSSVEPLHIDLGETNTNGDMSRVNGPGQRGMVSSLTQNSHDDSSGEGRHRKPRSRMKSGSSFTNSLDIIEEGENEGSKSMHCKAEGSSSEHGGGGTATRETNVIIAGNTENTSGSEPVLDAPSSQADDLVTNSKVAKPIPNSHVPDDHESQQNGLISAALPDESPDAMSHTMHTGWSTSMDSIQMENSYRTELAHEERKGISATLPEAGNVSQAELSHMVNTGWSSSMDSMPVDRKSTSGRTVLSNEMRSMEMDSMRLDESYRTELFNEQVLGRISERLTDDGPDSQFEMSHLVNTGWSSSIDSMPIDRSHRSDFADEMKGSMDSMPLDTSYRADSLAAKTKQRIISRTLPEDSSYNEGSDQYDTRWNIPPLPFDPSASGDIEENRINHGTTATMIKMDGSLTQRCVESKRKSIS